MRALGQPARRSDGLRTGKSRTACREESDRVPGGGWCAEGRKRRSRRGFGRRKCRKKSYLCIPNTPHSHVEIPAVSVAAAAEPGGGSVLRRRILPLRRAGGAAADDRDRHDALLPCRAGRGGCLWPDHRFQPPAGESAAARAGLLRRAHRTRRHRRLVAPYGGPAVAGCRGGACGGHCGGERCRGCGGRRAPLCLHAGRGAHAAPGVGAADRPQLPCGGEGLLVARRSTWDAAGGCASRPMPARGATCTSKGSSRMP